MHDTEAVESTPAGNGRSPQHIRLNWPVVREHCRTTWGVTAVDKCADRLDLSRSTLLRMRRSLAGSLFGNVWHLRQRTGIPLDDLVTVGDEMREAA